jgi:hypothetical protein
MPRAKMVVWRAFWKRAFPTWRVLECRKRVWKRITTLRQLQYAAFEACGCRCPVFPRARPRMCRREVWVAALSLIEAHSHTLSSFLGGSNFRDFGTRVPGNLGGKREETRGMCTCVYYTLPALLALGRRLRGADPRVTCATLEQSHKPRLYN